jgi:hypothetical protein
MLIGSRVLWSTAFVALLFHATNSPERTGAIATGLRMLPSSAGDPVLAPGTSFGLALTAARLDDAPVCLGLASMNDANGLPVTLGRFQRKGHGIATITARIPATIFPAEPAGSFVLYAGRCSTVAPLGSLGSMLVTIEPAVG